MQPQHELTIPAAIGVVSLRDIMARITRALEALADGDRGLAEQLLYDLASDVWKSIEAKERAS